MLEFIQLGDDPFSNACFLKIGNRVDAAVELLSPSCPSPQKTKYATWWSEYQRQMGIDPSLIEIVHATEQARKLAFSVVEDFRADGWKDDPRGLDPALGQGWITVNIDSTGIPSIFDGNHRASALRAAKIPVYARVWKRHGSWRKAADAYLMSPYQPYPHPDLIGRRVIRPDLIRYRVIADTIRDLNLGSVIELGSCTGAGSLEMASQGLQVLGVEQDTDRHYLACCLRKINSNLNIDYVNKPAHKLSDSTANTAIIGLSVWHHIASSKERVVTTLKSLSAAPCHFVELPESGCTRWSKRFCEEMGVHFDGAQKALLNLFTQIGGWKQSHMVYRDKQYANRETWLLTRDT